MMRDSANSSSDETRRWQKQIFISVWVTYFAFYLCRYNLPMAKTRLCATFSWGPEDIGIVFTALLIMYAIGQFVNGQLADRFGSRAIVSVGILGSVCMNLAVFMLVVVGASGAVQPRRMIWWLTLFWGANGFFQSMGWSPMVRIMAHWYPSAQRGKVMGLLGTCYQFGGAFSWFLAFFLTGYFVQRFGGDWRSVFLVPAVLFAAVGLFFFLTIRNCPEDVGLPAINRDEQEASGSGAAPRLGLVANVLRTLSNPYLWVVAGVFFFLDMNRYGFINWLPAYLDDQMGEHASTLLVNFKEVMKRCIHPLAGSAGAVLAGWATDRFFGGRRAPVIVILLLILGVSSLLFPYIDPHDTWLVIAVVALIGFCTYGPHILMVGHAAQDFGKKSGAAGAAGFIDGMGYIGAALAGWGAGMLIKTQGYHATFVVFGCAAILGAMLAALIWNVGPHTDRATRQTKG